jgi:hypothetical protein
MSDAALGDVDKGLTSEEVSYIEDARRRRKVARSGGGWLGQRFVERVSPSRIDWNCLPVPSGKRSMVNRLGMGIRQDFDRGFRG